MCKLKKKKWPSIVLFWVVYVLQGTSIGLLFPARSLYENPKADVNGTIVEVKHEDDNLGVYGMMSLFFIIFFASLVSRDFLDVAYSLLLEKDPGFHKKNGLGVLASCVLCCGMMVMVGKIMASTKTVANVMGNSLSIYVILQVDDALKDFINASGLPLWSKGERIAQKLERMREGDEKLRVWYTQGGQIATVSDLRQLGNLRIFAVAISFGFGLLSWIFHLAQGA